MADPFRPLALPAAPAAVAKASPATPAPVVAAGAPATAGPGARGGPGLSPLPPARPGLPLMAAAPPVRSVVPPAAAPRPAAPPTLVGTILGERPSAVFQQDARIRVVPLGTRLGPWKVISVSLDGAVVAGAGRTVGLRIGLGRAAEVTEAAPSAAEADSGVTGTANDPPRPAKAALNAPPVLPPAAKAETSTARAPGTEDGGGRALLHLVSSRPEAAVPRVASVLGLGRPARPPKAVPALTPDRSLAPPSHRPGVHRLKRRYHRRPHHRSHHRRSRHLFGHRSHLRFHRR